MFNKAVSVDNTDNLDMVQGVSANIINK